MRNEDINAVEVVDRIIETIEEQYNEYMQKCSISALAIASELIYCYWGICPSCYNITKLFTHIPETMHNGYSFQESLNQWLDIILPAS